MRRGQDTAIERSVDLQASARLRVQPRGTSPVCPKARDMLLPPAGNALSYTRRQLANAVHPQVAAGILKHIAPRIGSMAGVYARPSTWQKSFLRRPLMRLPIAIPLVHATKDPLSALDHERIIRPIVVDGTIA